VNLEHGRRRSLRVHELMALAWVLEVDNPLELLVPADEVFYPVAPLQYVRSEAARAWWMGETGPLREALAGAAGPGNPEVDALLAPLRDLSPEAALQELARLVLSLDPVPKRRTPPEDDTDGQD
jgi:hypothetical protein